MFNLEKAIKAWLRDFRKHRAFDPAAIREIELHLRDHIDDLVYEGHDEETAFKKAVESFGDVQPMAKEVLRNQRPGTGRHKLINTTMLNNYFKITVRNFWRYKFYTAVNVLGLTIGLTSVFLIALFVNDELSFDKFHEHKDELYRVIGNQYFDGRSVFPVEVTSAPVGPSLLEDYPEIIAFTRAYNPDIEFEHQGRKLLEPYGFMVDEGFFEMFTFPVISGSVAGFRERQNALVLTQKMADKYFPDEDPIGKSIKLDGEEHVVDAVIENVPQNSHLYFDFLVNFEKYLTKNPRRENDWDHNSMYTYVKLNKGSDLEATNEKIKGHIRRVDEELAVDIYLQPMTEIYLGEVGDAYVVSRKGEMIYVQVFSIVAVFILLISCINFMNLSTARASRRAKEVGLRKTIGAQREQLIFQFLSESMLVSFIAVLLSIFAIALILPSFNQLTDKFFVFEDLFATERVVQMTLGLIGVALVTGLLAGSYPAFFLSATRPIAMLQAKSASAHKGAGIRKALVVFQFMISIVLIIGSITVYNQLQFIQNVDIGYDKSNTIYASTSSAEASIFATSIRSQPGVIDAGLTNDHPARIMSSTGAFTWKPGQTESILIHNAYMDDRFLGTMGMKILEGRGFLPTDSAVVIINEKARELMGFKEPVGKTIDAYGEKRIVGLVQDFNFKSIHTEIEPLVIFYRKGLTEVYIKYEPEYEDKMVAMLEESWAELFPDSELDYYFLENDFKTMYKAEERTSILSTVFAVLAIIISCLGLFGLVSYAMEQRIKEIGIRKVLGASAANLFVLLTGDFARLVVISLVISIPFSWFVIDQWLQNFAYHISLSWWIFAVSALVALGITMLTVSYQSISASRANPVKALRYE